ncbi:hypothetical protein M422DRAFT_35452 [Sphaerobolus stellatus SS14]|uniref:tRNA-guanine(15) transglycosylase-like domain-containing protein n=1 Tax=Sphaerobolus stellatus (strain SS14) TaxID=990650 RepID=A0A0C9TTD5_SPHS4|nr:hypothetical protein M422DRAFT_35452 [Sphaerobolus stellatus SS14]
MTSPNALNPVPTFSFRLRSTSPSRFSPRTGHVTLTRSRPTDGHDSATIELPTPSLVCATSRGVIQHLSQDNVQRTPCAKWIHVPFESFLQIDPPSISRQEGPNPLHSFLGFSPSRHLLSLSLRDPADGREVPANGKEFVSTLTSRGTRKIAAPVFRSYVTTVLPDITFAMSDIPFTPPPHSQKRTTKSVDRSAQWLANILAPLNLPSLPQTPPTRLNVFVHMVGGIRDAARSAFSYMLREPLEPKERTLVQLKNLDEGVSGYVFDLQPLRITLLAEEQKVSLQSLGSPAVPHRPSDDKVCDTFVSLMHASLEEMPVEKPRLVNTTLSPHEMLILIRDVGIDLFDSFWVQQAATWGIALDFRFPVPAGTEEEAKKHLGHNLYDDCYAIDISRLADSFLDGLTHSNRGESADQKNTPPVCPCGACSPTWSNEPLIHSSLDEYTVPRGTVEPASPYTRAYIHHLLHTHEMSAHAFLAMHNFAVLDAFFAGIREVIERDPDSFENEVKRFFAVYDSTFELLDEAKRSYHEVDKARGKGRLAREKELQTAKVAEELDVPVPTVEVVEEAIQG